MFTVPVGLMYFWKNSRGAENVDRGSEKWTVGSEGVLILVTCDFIKNVRIN